jgi:hypothetical protein
MQRLIYSLHITRIIFTLSSHGSLTERAMTRASGNKINPDKHRLMHIHAPALYKRRCHHRPATNKENQHLFHVSYAYLHIITHVQARTYTRRYVSSHLYRCEAPLNQRGLGDRTPASGKVKSQLHSARWKTTWAKIISEKTVVDEVRSHVLVVRRRVPGHPSTGLQGTGSAVSVPHTRTNALDLTVCMPSASKVVCHALAVAHVNRRPCGLFPALLPESGMCARHTS